MSTKSEPPKLFGEKRVISERQKKIGQLRNMGIDPYPSTFNRTHTIKEAVAEFERLKSRPDKPNDLLTEKLSVAGRIIARRGMGKASFLDIKDNSGRIQCFARQNVMKEQYEILSYLDIGDIVGVEGPVMATRKGETSIEVTGLVVLTKALRPLPDKWSGLRDVEIRYRQKYLDLISNPKAFSNATLRSEIVSSIREFMHQRDFIEVETPILVPIAAGAQAKPFETHHNSLNRNLYLRIATELYLKKLIIGGFEKVFEIGKLFRNEGLDQYHNPEFTTMECYEAYTDYNDVMRLLEDLVLHTITKVADSDILPAISGIRPEIHLKPPWPRLDLRQTIIERVGFDFCEHRDTESLKSIMNDLNIYAEPSASWGRLLDKVISDRIEPGLIQPHFLVDYPVEMSPLAKRKLGSDGIVERFEAFVLGSELANAFSELNDPLDQRERFEEQERLRLQFSDDELDRLDEDFLIAIEHGMPPTGGLGLGIDRLVMLIAGEESIREILLFPQLRN